MTPKDEAEALELLRSMNSVLKSLLHLSQQRMVGPRTPKGPTVASDRELDGQYGNPTIKSADPRDWSGPSMKGRKFSECPAEYLDLLADRNDYFAEKAEEKNEMTDKGKPRAVYLRADAARARGWAARIRAGKAPAPAKDDADPGWSEGY